MFSIFQLTSDTYLVRHEQQHDFVNKDLIETCIVTKQVAFNYDTLQMIQGESKKSVISKTWP